MVKVVDRIQAEGRHAEAAVGRNRHVEFLRFFPERIKLRSAVKSPARRDRRQHGTDHAQFGYGAAQFFYCFANILDR